MDAYLKELDEKLKTALSRLKDELRGIRSNRPSVEFVEGLRADYYGNPTPLNTIGTVTIGGPREIVISLWDKAAVGPVMKAINDAQAGFSVSNDGNTIRASLSALSSERREELGRLAKKTAESARIEVRNIRDEMLKKLRAAEDRGEMTEDQTFDGKEKMQKRVNDANAEIEKAVSEKLAEIAE